MAPSSCQHICSRAVATLLLLLFSVAPCAYARSGPQHLPEVLVNPAELQEAQQLPEVDIRDSLSVEGAEVEELDSTGVNRGLKFLVPTPALVLPYHKGPILSGPSIVVYLIWYGTFSPAQKSIVTDFFDSFLSSSISHPSVSSWWNVTREYKDSAGASVSRTLALGGEMLVDYTMGTVLTEADVQTLVLESLTTFPLNAKAVYLVLTASGVIVQDFCLNSCGSHFATLPSVKTNDRQLPYAWVGNSAGSPQCEGFCAWPFAKAAYGPPGEPLLPPNGDVGMDGMMINLGVILGGMATDPFTNGFYQGDASAPLEAASACAGIYGTGAYPGYPGELLIDPKTGASYNCNGVNGRKYLMPALWSPLTLACTTPV